MVGTDLKFSGKMCKCSKVRYNKFRYYQLTGSCVIVGKLEGVASTPNAPARVKKTDVKGNDTFVLGPFLRQNLF